MRSQYAGSIGLRRLVGGGGAPWWDTAFKTLSGVSPVLALKYDTDQYMADAAASAFDALHTFTRASLATQRDNAGTLVLAPHNLLTKSEEFDHINWAKNDGATVSPDTDTAPDGASTADKLTITATSISNIRQTPSSLVDGTRFLAVWVKAPASGAATHMRITTNDNVAWNTGGSTKLALTTSWQLLSLTVAMIGSSMHVHIGAPDETGTADPDCIGDVLIWGAQFNRTPMAPALGTFATTYVPTTTAAVYQHRLDHDKDGVALGLLVEEARTNLCLWSDDQTNAAWVKTTMTAAKDQAGADGIANSASSLLATAGNSTSLQTITSASATRVFSVLIKRITGTGVIEITTDNGVTWVDVTSAIDATNYIQVATGAQLVTNPVLGFRVVTSGDKIAVQFAQSEVGGFETSPIPTTTVAVTRAADTATVDVSAMSFYQTGDVSIFIKAYGMAADPEDAPGYNLYGDSSVSTLSRIEADFRTTERLFAYYRNPITFEQSQISLLAPTMHDQFFKIAHGCAANDFAASYNGATVGTNSSVVPVDGFGEAGDDKLVVGAGQGTTGFFNGYISQLVVYDSRLPNADLEAIATL